MIWCRQQKLQESKEELQVLIEEKGHLEQVRRCHGLEGGQLLQRSPLASTWAEAIHGPKTKLKAMLFTFPSATPTP